MPSVCLLSILIRYFFYIFPWKISYLCLHFWLKH